MFMWVNLRPAGVQDTDDILDKLKEAKVTVVPGKPVSLMISVAILCVYTSVCIFRQSVGNIMLVPGVIGLIHCTYASSALQVQDVSDIYHRMQYPS